jgi:hypothetical protein
MMHDREKSHSAIVAGKPTNNGGSPAAVPLEPREGDREERGRAKHTPDTEPVCVTQALERVRQAA